MKPPSRPFSRLAAPSSSSTYCSARCSASALTATGSSVLTASERVARQLTLTPFSAKYFSAPG